MTVRRPAGAGVIYPTPDQNSFVRLTLYYRREMLILKQVVPPPLGRSLVWTSSPLPCPRHGSSGGLFRLKRLLMG